MAQNIFRRDTRSNLLDLPPSRKEIVTIEDEAKFGLLRYGTLRTIAQLLEKNTGIEVRDWDINFGKGISGINSFDVSTSINEYGTGGTGAYSFVSGIDTSSSGDNSFSCGKKTEASGDNSFSCGDNTEASGDGSFSCGSGNVASGLNSNVSGFNSVASGEISFTHGITTTASGLSSVAFGANTIASGKFSHAEGNGSNAIGENSFACGNITTSHGFASRSDGNDTSSIGRYSHAEGNQTETVGESSHAEGVNTKAVGIGSHASGFECESNGDYSTTSGRANIANNSNETVTGQFNSPNIDTLFSVGIGVDETERKNGFEVSKVGKVSAPNFDTANITEPKDLVTREFLEEKIEVVTWANDFDYSSGSGYIFQSDIPIASPSNISRVYLGGILLRGSKYSIIDNNGFKSVQISDTITLNDGDWVSLQNTKVFVQG